MNGKFITSAIFTSMMAFVTPAVAESFTATFKWCTKEAQTTISPAFTLRGVPKGTTVLSFYMFDHNANYNHGGGTVQYKGGNTVACGAISDGWVGPFPPNGQVHTYEFSIKALDSKGGTLGAASAIREFPEQ